MSALFSAEGNIEEGMKTGFLRCDDDMQKGEEFHTVKPKDNFGKHRLLLTPRAFCTW